MILLGACPMLSTDLYLPALPTISRYYGTTDSMTNFTMIAFTIALAVSSLLWGPISDKYGRRPVVIVGSAFYFAGSLISVFAPSIQALIFARVIQAIGGGSASMAAPALVRDVYDEQHQEKILSLVQGMALLGPAVAPSIGALVLRGTDWHGIFVIMAAMGAVVFVGALFVKETLVEPLTVGVLSTFKRLWAVMKNPRFAKVAIVFTIPAVPIMAFITASPFIFQTRFGLSEQVFSLFFAASAIAMMGGAFSYFPISRRIGHTATAYLCLAVLALTGLFTLLVGGHSPWIFICLIAPSSFCCAMTKPFSVFLGLNAAEKSDTGSASSLLNFLALIFSSGGMLSLVLFNDFLSAVGALYLISGALAAALLFVWFRKI